MAEDAVTQAALLAGLEDRDCVTRRLRIHGYHAQAKTFGALSFYGSDAVAIQDMIRLDPATAIKLQSDPQNDLPYVEAQVRWAVREEMARTVSDVLARRLRALTLNARAALAMSPRVAELVRSERGLGEEWARTQTAAFAGLASGYVPLAGIS
jgi:glycerol-3-phosphate dehydrogenase